MVPTNPLKAGVAGGRLQVGLWQALASPYSAEICAGSDFDWLLFDGEHAPNDVPLMLAQIQAVAPYSVHPVARLPASEAWMIKQYLDIGFSTLMIPMVETAEQAATIVRACRYPPHGVRGVGTGLARAARWNRIADYVHGADPRSREPFRCPELDRNGDRSYPQTRQERGHSGGGPCSRKEICRTRLPVPGRWDRHRCPDTRLNRTGGLFHRPPAR